MLKFRQLCLIVSMFVLVGCQSTIPIAVHQDKLIKPASPANLKFTMLSKAKDVRTQAINQIGRHTISLLMIPGFMVITENEDLEVAIIKRVRETLTSYGFAVTIVDKLEQSKDPVLVIQIDDLRNYLFSWLYPLGITWGKMELSLHLMSPDAKDLWKANLEGSSGTVPSIFYMCGFDTRVKDDLTANMNQLVEVVSSKAFAEQLKKAQVSGGTK